MKWAGSDPTLLAIFAHPDDETFRPGGTLALLTTHGVHVELLTFTHGGVGSCGEPLLCTQDQLPAVREHELHCACEMLGIRPPRLLDYPDGQLQQANHAEMVEHILSVTREIRPQVFISFGPDGLSGHLDHIAVGQWASEAFRRAEDVAALYTAAVPHSLAEELDMRQIHSVPDSTITLSVDVASVWETKLAAMRCHATQWSSSPLASTPQGPSQRFFGREYFVRAAGRDTSADFLPAFIEKYLI